MIGGALVGDDYCKKIGTDCYIVDDGNAADESVEYFKVYIVF